MSGKWKMPKWMEPYRAHICNTGGNDIEGMVNGNADPMINLPLSTLQACVKSQVSLLQRMHDAGLLGQPRVNGMQEQNIWREIEKIFRSRRLLGNGKMAREIFGAVLREVRR